MLAGCSKAWVASVFVAGLVAGPVMAGETVIFSDTDGPAAPVEIGKPESRRTARVPGALDWGKGGGSLDAVRAAPFSLPAPPPAPSLTPQQREALERQKDWILAGPGEQGEGGLPSAEKVFGVSDFGKSQNATAPDASESRVNLIRLYDRLNAANEAANAAAVETRPSQQAVRGSLEPLSPRPFGEFYQGLGEPRAGTDFGSAAVRSRSASFTPSWVVDHDPLERKRERARQQAIATGLGTAGAGTTSALDGTDASLGGNLIGNPLAKGMASPIDPINLYPDLTRQAMNPVVVDAFSPPVASSPMPAFDDPAISPDRSRSLAGPDAFGLLPVTPAPKPAARASDPNADKEKRSLHSIKLQLDLPRRSF